MEAPLADSVLIAKIIKRLEERQKRFSLAREIFEGIRKSNPPAKDLPFAGERDVPGGGLCSNPGGSGRFDCATNDFTCASFSCDPSFKYSNCNGSANGFNCNDGTFSCDNGKGGANTFYDCDEFSCGGPAKEYTCNADYDHYCEDQFDCTNKNTCSAGHIFRCNDDYNCKDTFTCSADGRNGCVPAFPYNSDESDHAPGDFGCGTHGGNKDVFNCEDTFKCLAKDEFECELTTKFKCGDGAEPDDFKCETTEATGKGFQCETKNGFTCKGTFNCPTIYNDKADIPTLSPLGMAILTTVLGGGGALLLWHQKRRQEVEAEVSEEA